MRGREAGLSSRPASLFRTSSLLQISVGKAALCLQRIVGVDGRSGLGGGNDVRSQKKELPGSRATCLPNDFREKHSHLVRAAGISEKCPPKVGGGCAQREGRGKSRLAAQPVPAVLSHDGTFQKAGVHRWKLRLRRQEKRLFAVPDAVPVCLVLLRATVFPGTGTDLCVCPERSVLLV